MSKFNAPGSKPARRSGPATPMKTTGTTTTHGGGNAYVRDAKSDLYLLAVVNMVGEDKFYERARESDDRFSGLVHQVVRVDPSWVYRFLGWLRNRANMRSASIVVAAESVKARLDAGISLPFTHGGAEVNTKHFIRQGMARADEPGELLAYWASKYGTNFPAPVKRGVAMAAVDLYDEYSYAKYGRSDSSAYQMADVIELVHPKAKDSVKVDKTCPTPEKARFATKDAAPNLTSKADMELRAYECRCGWFHLTRRPEEMSYEIKPETSAQGDLFKYMIDMRHKREELVPASLPMLQHRDVLMAMPQGERRAFLASDGAQEELKRAGMTWESLSGWIGGELDASFWEGIIPTMGYMALLRNLRNFDKAGISRAARNAVQERLADPRQVAKSRQLPFRFLSAYRAVESDHWGEALGDALDASAGNLPVFSGRTLVLVDSSGSMTTTPISKKSTITCADIGALFGVVLARSGADMDLWGFAGDGYWRSTPLGKAAFKHDLPKGGSALKGIQGFVKRFGEVGYGTELGKAFRQSYDGHDRVIVITDGQSYDTNLSTLAPADVKTYLINPAGYATAQLDLSKRNRYEIGGFSDQVFRMISLLEAGDGNWPF